MQEVAVGERIPPEGAAEESPHNTVAVKKNVKSPAVGVKGNAAKEAVDDLMKATEDDQDLHMLRKLINEGRISGLNEKPPSFHPPTPPTKPTNSSPVSSKPSANHSPVSKTPSKRQPEGRKNESPVSNVKVSANSSPASTPTANQSPVSGFRYHDKPIGVQC